MNEVEIRRREFPAKWRTFRTLVAIKFVQALQRRCPVDTGRLKGSISWKVDEKGILISMAHYAIFVEFGTAPHLIEPKNGKFLHWKSGSTDVFAKLVHHPGTRPNPFIRTTLRLDMPRIVKTSLLEAFA